MTALNDLLLSRSAARWTGGRPPPRALDGEGTMLGAVLALEQPATHRVALNTAAVVAAVAQAETPSSPARINPTNRKLRFIVPLTDGPTYLGDVELAVAPDDSLSIVAPRLLQMLEPLLQPDTFGRLKAAVGTKAEVTQAQLAAEKIVISYDAQKLALAITVPVAARRPNNLSLASSFAGGGETLQPAAFSAYLNLRSAFDVVERGPDRGFAPPVSVLDGAVRAFGIVAENEAYLSFRRDDPLVRRTGSRLVHDDLRRVIRWTFGDLRLYSRSFQAAPAIAGLSAARLYSVLDPSRDIRSTGSQSFTLFAPSNVETLVNGRSVERKLLQPGTYTLNDFPLAEGSNDVRLKIEDQTGQSRTLEFSLYSNRQLLQPGATEFFVTAGAYSEPTRSGIAYSGRWTTSGFVRRGISQQLAAGLNLQADEDAQQAGSEVLIGSSLGLIGIDVAGSRRSGGGTGYAAGITFEKLLGGSSLESQSLRAQVEYRSADFAIPGALTPREPLELRSSVGWSMTLGRGSFIAVDGQYGRDRELDQSRYGVRGSGGVQVSDTLAAVGEVEWERSRERDGGLVRIGLRKRFGFRGSAQVDVDSRGLFRANYQRSQGRGIGAWTGSIDVNRTPDGTALNGNGTYIGNRVEMGVSQIASYDARGGAVRDVRTSVRAGTSIAFADGALALGRPIQDSFLIAEPHRSLEGKQVRLDPQEDSENARSGMLGGAVEGSLSAYSPRLLIYDVPEAPAGYDLGQGNVQLRPPYRAGYKLEIGSDYNLLVIGRLVDRTGEPVSLLAGTATDLGAPKRPAVTMFTARNGRFGAQGLRAGRWRIEMPTEPPTIYEIEVRDDPSGTVRLGDVRPLEQGKGE